MLTSIVLGYTTIEKNEQMQPVKVVRERPIRVEEIALGSKTATELGMMGFKNVRRFKARFVPGLKDSKVNYVKKGTTTYSVNSIKDDGSGKFVTIEVSLND